MLLLVISCNGMEILLCHVTEIQQLCFITYSNTHELQWEAVILSPGCRTSSEVAQLGCRQDALKRECSLTPVPD